MNFCLNQNDSCCDSPNFIEIYQENQNIKVASNSTRNNSQKKETPQVQTKKICDFRIISDRINGYF